MKLQFKTTALAIAVLASMNAFLTSCEGGHLANIEVDITDVQASGNSDGLVKKTIQENSIIVYVDTTKMSMKNMTLNYSVSEGATYEYVVPNAKQSTEGDDISADHYDAAGKVVTDYTSPVYIRVTAARGIDPNTGKIWCKVWKVKTQALTDNMPTKYTFDNWETPLGCYYMMPYDLMTVNGEQKPIRMWDSTCGSLTPIWSFIYGANINYNNFGSQPTDDAVKGKALKLVTADISWADARKPFVAGCLFLGEMDNENTDDQMKTRVGLPFNKRPTTLKFYYKYEPGVVASTGKTDEGYIRVVLYRTDSDVQYLTGYNIKNNDFANTVAYAELKPNEMVSEYKLVEIPFTYTQDINEDDLKNWKYNIGIYLASSYGGFEYSGCGNTTMYIDEMEIVCE